MSCIHNCLLVLGLTSNLLLFYGKIPVRLRQFKLVWSAVVQLAPGYHGRLPFLKPTWHRMLVLPASPPGSSSAQWPAGSAYMPQYTWFAALGLIWNMNFKSWGVKYQIFCCLSGPKYFLSWCTWTDLSVCFLFIKQTKNNIPANPIPCTETWLKIVMAISQKCILFCIFVYHWNFMKETRRFGCLQFCIRFLPR